MDQRERDRRYVYIMASHSGVLYVGVCRDLLGRVNSHRDGRGSEFTRMYRVKKLVYVEEFNVPIDAYEREKQIKSWRRSKKVSLIEAGNPEWADLFPLLMGIQKQGPSTSLGMRDGQWPEM